LRFFIEELIFDVSDTGGKREAFSLGGATGAQVASITPQPVHRAPRSGHGAQAEKMNDYMIIDDEYEEYEEFERRLIEYLVALAGLCQPKGLLCV